VQHDGSPTLIQELDLSCRRDHVRHVVSWLADHTLNPGTAADQVTDSQEVRRLRGLDMGTHVGAGCTDDGPRRVGQGAELFVAVGYCNRRVDGELAQWVAIEVAFVHSGEHGGDGVPRVDG